MYLVDFVAVNLVSCMVMIAGLLIVLLVRYSKLGRAVFNEEAFQVMMCVSWHVVWISCALVMGMLGIGGGWEYSVSGVLWFSASVRSLNGRNGNLFVSVCRFICSFCRT